MELVTLGAFGFLIPGLLAFPDTARKMWHNLRVMVYGYQDDPQYAAFVRRAPDQPGRLNTLQKGYRKKPNTFSHACADTVVAFQKEEFFQDHCYCAKCHESIHAAPFLIFSRTAWFCSRCYMRDRTATLVQWLMLARQIFLACQQDDVYRHFVSVVACRFVGFNEVIVNADQSHHAFRHYAAFFWRALFSPAYSVVYYSLSENNTPTFNALVYDCTRFVKAAMFNTEMSGWLITATGGGKHLLEEFPRYVSWFGARKYALLPYDVTQYSPLDLPPQPPLEWQDPALVLI